MSPVDATVSLDVEPSGPSTVTTMTFGAMYVARAVTCRRDMPHSVPR
jgi:hypothetical protein